MSERVLVVGGAGEVGEGIVRAWLRAGARVGVISRDAARLARLEEATSGLPGALVTRQGELTSVAELVEALGGPLDCAVASVGGGGWRLAPLSSIEPAMFARVVEDGVIAHFTALRAVMPSVRAGGTYTMINGGAALEVVPGTGPLSIVARAQLAMTEVLAAELQAERMRVQALVLGTPIVTRSRTQTRPGWLTADDAGDACVALARHGAHGAIVTVRARADVDALMAGG